jgi:cyclic-di-AMP phosphodiesterase PgpH
MNMAALSEAAAESIGANYLQVRIACYYHDIGKSLRPQYFIENQRTGINPHDRLSPEQSARIIMTHVIDGVTIGQKYNLPKPIMDAIETHHGTSLIKYFYVRAVEEAGSKEKVDETLYRYQGRLPDTRESGIIFLADRVEAACRSLKEPSRKAYRDMTQKLVNAAIAEGQLEQCPLTIQEIYTIIRVFTETMVDIQHHRIEYPNLPEEKKEETITLEVPNPLHEKEEIQNESG